MNTPRNLTRIIAGALLSGGIAVAGLGLSLGIAQADNNYGPHHWCPGQSMNWPTGPFNQVVWDMNVCHTWYIVELGAGNVPERTGGPSNIWDGDNPPPPASQRCGPPTPVPCGWPL
jgi:hypothetical protein